MKKKKLQLKDLKVKSFVTNLSTDEMSHAKGGQKIRVSTGRAIRRTNIRLPWNIRIHAWTISEIRNDGRPYKSYSEDNG